MLIFKAKNVNYREKLFKYLFVITAAAVLTAYLSGLYLKKTEAALKGDIENNIQQIKKYRYLSTQTSNSNTDILVYIFLEKVVRYSENIILENLYLDRKEIIIYAQTDKEEHIFQFLDKLKEDDIFLKTELREIEKNNLLNFTIRADLISR